MNPSLSAHNIINFLREESDSGKLNISVYFRSDNVGQDGLHNKKAASERYLLNYISTFLANDPETTYYRHKQKRIIVYKRGVQKAGLSLFLTGSLVLLGVIFLSKSALAFTGGGTGTALDPYEIYSCQQLQEISDDLAAHYELLDDIDCTGVSYDPIGDEFNPFTGSLDGNLQTISNISVNNPSDNYQGIFANTNGAAVKNIKLSNNAIIGSSIVGLLTGQAVNGTISNIRADSTNIVSGDGDVGGIVGSASSSSVAISRSFFKGTVSLTGAYGGGILGYGTGSINLSDSYSSGTINGGVSYVGGVVGSFNSGTPVVSRVYSSATINGSGAYYGGLLGGFFSGTVQNSFSAADMSANAVNSGGLFGLGNGTSTNNYLDEFAANISNCSDTGVASCTTVNSGNANPNYFINNNSNPPLDTWNFDYYWFNPAGLPDFPDFGAVQVDIPEVTSNSINFGYTFLGVQGTSPTTSPEIRFRKTGSLEQWTYLSNVQIENFDLTISGLETSTEYTIEIRALYEGVGEYSDWSDGSFSATTLGAVTTASSENISTTENNPELAETGDNQIMLSLISLLAFSSACGLLLRIKFISLGS